MPTSASASSPSHGRRSAALYVALPARGAAKDPLEHSTVIKLAAKYRKTAAQVVLRWHIDHGLSPIPKSARPERIAENIDIFDFLLAEDDRAAIDAMDTGVRRGPDPEIFDATMAPVKMED